MTEALVPPVPPRHLLLPIYLISSANNTELAPKASILLDHICQDLEALGLNPIRANVDEFAQLTQKESQQLISSVVFVPNTETLTELCETLPTWHSFVSNNESLIVLAVESSADLEHAAAFTNSVKSLGVVFSSDSALDSITASVLETLCAQAANSGAWYLVHSFGSGAAVIEPDRDPVLIGTFECGVVNTHGVDEAFMAGVLNGLAQEWQPNKAARFGSFVASGVAEIDGEFLAVDE
ncbi:hypothetical protein [Arcanobacterium bovis]|uniref:Uncharacterized protein n=1 Tax=Arcanobacterium bovis TaxID=2529275 RepID=A0A4Q9V0X5_9ACTO|nr:hypothetical protein [Arcanobacterium bovis]TBW21406.1 hypothetical protein EZJ44_05500 [Arcanobacterium bovis]